MNWLKDVIGTGGAIIAMCHLQAVPGDPYYDAERGVDWVAEKVKENLCALQSGSVDTVMSSGGLSLSYLTRVKAEAVAAMVRVIGGLKPFIKVPFGINVLWDPIAPPGLATATGALFVREIISGVCASDFGLWNTNTEEAAKHQDRLDAKSVKLLYNTMPETAKYLANQDIKMVARVTVFNCRPDTIYMSDATAGGATDVYVPLGVKSILSDMVIIVNTGCRKDTIEGILKIADAAVVGTTSEYGGGFESQVDMERMKEFMGVMRMVRAL